MSTKLKANETVSGGGSLTEPTATYISSLDKAGLDFVAIGGTVIDPRAKYVEAVYTVSDTVVTYSYYESASKLTTYNTITVTHTNAQDTTFTSALWA